MAYVRIRVIQVENQLFSDAYRVLLIPSGLEQAITGPSINGLVPRSFQTNILGNLFTSADLPLVPPPLSSASNFWTFNMLFSGGGVGASAQGVVTSLTAVPEPSALELTGMGLLVFIGVEMRRRWVARTQ